MTTKTFKELYEEERRKPTPAQAFRREVASITKRSEATVKMWLVGTQRPDGLARTAIAKRFGVKAESLFPNE